MRPEQGLFRRSRAGKEAAAGKPQMTAGTLSSTSHAPHDGTWSCVHVCVRVRAQSSDRSAERCTARGARRAAPVTHGGGGAHTASHTNPPPRLCVPQLGTLWRCCRPGLVLVLWPGSAPTSDTQRVKKTGRSVVDPSSSHQDGWRGGHTRLVQSY